MIKIWSFNNYKLAIRSSSLPTFTVTENVDVPKVWRWFAQVWWVSLALRWKQLLLPLRSELRNFEASVVRKSKLNRSEDLSDSPRNRKHFLNLYRKTKFFRTELVSVQYWFICLATLKFIQSSERWLEISHEDMLRFSVMAFIGPLKTKLRPNRRRWFKLHLTVCV